MTTHPISAPNVPPEAARRLYAYFGELTQQECETLSNLGRAQRSRYFQTIYGYHAGKVARAEYNRWRRDVAS